MSYDDAVSKIKIPPYSKKQELFNSLSHLLGLPLSLVVIFFAIYKFSINSISLLSFTGLLIFALTIVIVYSFSQFTTTLIQKHSIKNISSPRSCGDIFVNRWNLHSDMFPFNR